MMAEVESILFVNDIDNDIMSWRAIFIYSKYTQFSSHFKRSISQVTARAVFEIFPNAGRDEVAEHIPEEYINRVRPSYAASTCKLLLPSQANGELPSFSFPILYHDVLLRRRRRPGRQNEHSL